METTYKNMCKILDYCYALTLDNDLGGLLGELSCELFSDDLPVDLAAYSDWLNLVSSCGNKSIIEKIVLFLEMYEKNYGFNFSKTKSCLKNIDDKILNLILANNS